MKHKTPQRAGPPPQPLHQRLDLPAAAPQAAAPSASGLLELLADALAASDLDSAVHQLCQRLAAWSGARRVVLGLSDSQGNVKVAAISDVSNFDRRAELMLALEAALDETLARRELAWWTSACRDNAPIYRRLTRLAAADAVIGIPLRNQRGEPVGAVLLCGDTNWHSQLSRSPALAFCQSPLAGCLDLLRDARGGKWRASWAAWKARARRLRTRAALASVALGSLIMLLPIPYKVKCSFTVEPVTRRYIASPFDGTLDKAFVEPGSVVRQGQVLAVMDDRELRLELAGLEAELGAARKKRVAALATREAATAQLAALETAQLETKIETVSHRLRNLSIQCPMDGIVVSGDLRRTEGAPLSIGQTLFEIAPPDQMIAEIAVPQEEVNYVRRNMPVDLRFDAYPGQRWTGELSKVHPRAELRDQTTVFIAEVTLANPDRRLSPGMSGRARIESSRRSVGWILFHRSVNALAQRLGW